jgi:hypothetical protein
MKRTASILAIAFALFLCGPIARSQGAPAAAKPSSETPPAKPNPDTLPVRTFYLSNVAQQYEANDIVSSIRNILPNNDRIYVVSSQNAIVVRGTPEDLALTQKVITDLDRPKKNYRLTYTVTEMDGGKQIGVQHYAMIMTSGQTTSLKLGNRVPVATGASTAGVAANLVEQTQFTYIDVGMNFDATLTAMGENAMLKSSVDQSGAAPEKSDSVPHQPIIRQASLKGESFLAPGKPLVLGSMDIPGSTSHTQIEVVMEPLP